jgi:hypothetical protein
MEPDLSDRPCELVVSIAADDWPAVADALRALLPIVESGQFLTPSRRPIAAGRYGLVADFAERTPATAPPSL